MLIPLRVYSEYSLLKSSIKPNQIIEYCKNHKINHCGLANDNSFFGALSWCLELKKNNIKTIFGSALKVEKGYVWVYCLNEEGYIELSNKLTDSYLYHQGILKIEHLEFKNCILLCDLSISSEQIVELSKKNQVTLALTRQKRDQKDENMIFKLSNEYNLPIVAAPKIFYSSKEKQTETDCLWCIRNNTYIQEQDRENLNDDEYLKTPSEYEKDFQDIPWAIENAKIFAKKCNFILKTHPPRMPKIGVDNPNDVFAYQVWEGLEKRLKNDILPKIKEEKHQETISFYEKRVQYEIEMITKMNFCEYFLIVSDIVKWSKNNNILVGPGRGSGASSMAAYCLEITNIDPIKFNLMFERFLNPDRVSLPDFDIDFCQENRNKVIEYIQKRFGKENVAHIITFGTLQYRAALRDIGRVLQMPYSLVDLLCKKLPPPFQGVAPTLKELREKKISTELINHENEQLFNIAENVEGLHRHCSMHAAGIVIGSMKLSNIVPLYKENDSEIPMIQFAMKDAEAIGLVKFDILGLTILSTISKTLNFLKRKNINLDLDKIDLEDPKIYEMLSKGKVNSVFQLDSIGFKNLMKQMQPNCFEDIIAAGALYRPGPMADIPQFIACKHGAQKIQYPYPEMESILKDTYGVVVYQEQVLQIAKEMAGYSLKEADLLRRAMGKKIHSEMEKHKEVFIEGILKICKGEKQKAETLFENLSRFASYGFPKAHATPYAIMTYQTAYLKYYHTIEFLCATMNYEINLEKIEEIIQEAESMNIKVIPPSINISNANFDIINEAIYFGLGKIKGIGEIANTIIAERKENGNFQSIHDFIKRIKPNKRVIENLIYSGAFDCFGEHRNAQLHSINKQEQINLSLFDDIEEKVEEFNEIEIAKYELETLGYVFSRKFLEKSYKNLKIFNSINEIKTKGLLLALGIQPIVKKNKDGKILYAYEFLDKNGIQRALCSELYDFKMEKILLEIENTPTRFIIKNIYELNNYFNKYKKIFLKENIEINLPEGNTSIYLINENFNNIFLGNFSLNIDFLEKNFIKIMF